MGFESISVGGVKVRKQEFGLVNEAGWPGDNVTGGVFGLGFPDITSVYTDRVSNTTQEPYNPFFFNAVKDKLVSNPCVCSYPPFCHLSTHSLIEI